MPHQDAPCPCRCAGPIGQIGFEIGAPAIDEVIADVGGTIGQRAVGCRVARALDRFERHPHLAFAA